MLVFERTQEASEQSMTTSGDEAGGWLLLHIVSTYLYISYIMHCRRGSCYFYVLARTQPRLKRVDAAGCGWTGLDGLDLDCLCFWLLARFLSLTVSLSPSLSLFLPSLPLSPSRLLYWGGSALFESPHRLHRWLPA